MCHDEGETNEEEAPSSQVLSPEKISRPAIAASPLASAPEVAIHIILIHTMCSTFGTTHPRPIQAFKEGWPAEGRGAIRGKHPRMEEGPSSDGSGESAKAP